MLSLESCASGWCALCSSMSCARRSAQAIPAGPPPMMTTSASICGRSMPSRGLRKVIIKLAVPGHALCAGPGLIVVLEAIGFEQSPAPGLLLTGLQDLSHVFFARLRAHARPCLFLFRPPSGPGLAAAWRPWEKEALRFGLLDLFSQCRNNLEKVPDDPDIGNFKDGRFRVFVDGDNRA